MKSVQVNKLQCNVEVAIVKGQKLKNAAIKIERSKVLFLKNPLTTTNV